MYVRIRSYSGLYFPAFGLNTKRYSVSLRIQSECGKMRIGIARNTGTFYGVCSLRKGSKDVGVHLILEKINEAKQRNQAKIGQDQEALISVSASFLAVVAKVFFLERKVGTRFCL